jgi:hypothetical protein
MEEEKKEHEAEHEHSHEHHKKMDLTNKFRENPWMLATLICGVLAVVLLISTISGGIINGNVSAKVAGENLLSFYQSMGIENLTIDSVKEVSGLYEVDFSYKGSIIPIYVTKDGKAFTESLTPTGNAASNSDTTTTEVPKSDKPLVELYVYAYCPYGTQMEKAIIPAVKLLGNTIDFKIRQIGAMHGDFEKVEAERQLCIEKNYPDKLLDYILAFDTDSTCSTGDAACVATKTSSIYSKLGIDQSKINSCIASEGVTMYNAEVKNAQSKGVSGSPTLIINGVDASPSNRSPEAVKGAICSAFNNVASACSTTLSTDSASAGFGGGTGSSSSASC